MRARAMDFLHQMDYNYIKAKFYIFFPYYKTYNQYRCHMPLNFSNQQMQKKIKDHIEALKNTKEKDLTKWIGTVENSIDNRVSLAKLNTLIEIAKQNKYQIPETIKDQIDRAVKTGKELRKFIQGVRITIDKLIAKKEQLNQNKIVTNDMIQFEQTVNRCQEWVKKQSMFEQKYYQFYEDQSPTLKPIQQKVQFKLIQTLTNQYNNLPLSYDTFLTTTKILYNTTMNILDRLPPFTKMTKTRTSNPSKYTYELIKKLLEEIKQHPVYHQEFNNFEMIVNDSLEIIERVSMFLEDDRTEKSVKILNNYLKLITEIPIQNKVQNKLQNRLQYYELMEKIKKDIMNPQKFDTIKEYIKKLRDRGFENIQHANYESKLRTYIGWIQSAQLLTQQRETPTYYDLIKFQQQIKHIMVNAKSFDSQLMSAQKQLNIGEQSYAQFYLKLSEAKYLSQQIAQLLQNDSPNISFMIDKLFKCIKIGLSFPQFDELYQRVTNYLVIISKIHYILDIHNRMLIDDEETLFLTKKQSEDILLLNKNSKQQLKEIRSREGAQEIMNEIDKCCFPKNLLQWKLFNDFMVKDTQCRNNVLDLIREFQTNTNILNSKQIIDQAKKCLYSKNMDEEVNKIQSVLKWREKISKKVLETKQDIFDQTQKNFIVTLQNDLTQLENNLKNEETTKYLALTYYQKNSKSIKQVLQTINDCSIQMTYKLSQLNKFCKQIDKEVEKYQLNDKKIVQLRGKLQLNINKSQQWKEKYLAIKRFEQKKIRQLNQQLKSQANNQNILKPVTVSFQFDQFEIQDIDEMNENGNNQNQEEKNNNIEQQNKNKQNSKNGQFNWYFKLLLMIIEFYNGYNLQFALEQLIKLKTILSDIYKFICHYDTIMVKSEATDNQLQNLQIEGNRITIFFRQIWVLRKKMQYINAWKLLANQVLQSVPIINLQLRARKPQDLLNLIESQKKLQQIEEGSKLNSEQKKPQENRSRRRPKPNQFYVNEDMTIITQQAFGNRTKKKRKGNNNDAQYRNTSVNSLAKQQAKKKQLDYQRTQALLKGDIGPQLFYQDASQYCICRFGELNQNTLMIQCQGKCQEWFHIECIGMKKSQTKGQNNLYICIGCKSLYNMEENDSVGSFFWDHHTKITQSALLTIIQQGKQLNVSTNEMKKMEVIHEKMIKWKQKSHQLIERCIRDQNQENIQKNDQQLYQLYLHSFWLPTVHPQSSILRKLLLALRGQI